MPGALNQLVGIEIVGSSSHNPGHSLRGFSKPNALSQLAGIH